MRAHLLNRCPLSPPEAVRRTIAADLGAPPEALFASFDPVPIASASLAQVHVARLPDGRKLAVKVQHAGLRETSAADTATIAALAAAARLAFPDFDLSWLVDEIRLNLPLELDFRHEAANAARCRANLGSPRSRVAGRRARARDLAAAAPLRSPAAPPLHRQAPSPLPPRAPR
jgi:aarF domain-containing kinase